MKQVFGGSNRQEISPNERIFIDRVRGLSIIRVVLVHLGLTWFYTPYSQFFHSFLPLLFFVSGAVSFFSCHRSASGGQYLFKRLLSIAGPLYVISVIALVIYWLVKVQTPEFDFGEIFRWVLINPAADDTPFPMGQIWFIHAMVVIVLVSFPVFVLSRGSILPLVFCILFSLALSLSHQINDIDGAFYFYGHNFYQGLVNIGFFVFGAVYYRRIDFFNFKIISVLFFVSVLVVLLNIFVVRVDINMANHSYAPDTYYLSASFSVIFLVLMAKNIINYVCERFFLFDGFVLFFSKHAFSIFIIHSFAIFFLEKSFGLVEVKASLGLAFLKVILVFSISAVLAIPATWLSGRITKGIRALYINRNAPSHISTRSETGKL